MGNIENLLQKISLKDAYLIENPINIRYFTGFFAEGFLLIADGKPHFFTDFRYIEDVTNSLSDIKPVLIRNKKEQVKELIKRSEGLHIETEYQTVSSAKKYEEYGKNMVCNGVLDAKIKELRIVKSEEEILYMKKASDISEAALKIILPEIRLGIKEREIALKIEKFMREQGANSVSFPLITITGQNTSKPHGIPGETTVKCGDLITLDIGCKWKGYCSDMTRTVAVGSVSDEQIKVYDTVLSAQNKALSRIKAGTLCKDVDIAARELIDMAGYDGCFGHSTGHGVGLEIHEAPNVSAKSEITLCKGMVITCEPGIYLNRRFGVRIEDMVSVTEDGYDNFNKFTKKLIVL